MPLVHGCHIPFIGSGYVLVSGRRPACSPSWCSLGIALSVQRSFLVEGSWTCEVWLSFVQHRGGGLLSCRKYFCSAVWVGSHLAESFPVGAWVGASFLADRDFLLEVLLVHATGLESSFSRLSDWMGVASFTSSAVKTFAVCVVMWGARVVELATLRGFCQPAATSSRESRFFPFLLVWSAHSPLWLWRALLISCTGSGTIYLEVFVASTLPTGTLLIWFGGVSLLGLLETCYFGGELA